MTAAPRRQRGWPTNPQRSGPLLRSMWMPVTIPHPIRSHKTAPPIHHSERRFQMLLAGPKKLMTVRKSYIEGNCREHDIGMARADGARRDCKAVSRNQLVQRKRSSQFEDAIYEWMRLTHAIFRPQRGDAFSEEERTRFQYITGKHTISLHTWSMLTKS